jgi:hypothetical protein
LKGVVNLDKEHLDTLEPMKYAKLEDLQLKQLKELEQQFNHEFGTDYFFMVMQKDRNEKTT